MKRLKDKKDKLRDRKAWNDCYMLYSKNKTEKVCRALADMTNCGDNCPFKKTLEKQTEIEIRICQRLYMEENPLALEYRSAIDGEVLLPRIWEHMPKKKEVC